MNGFDRSSKSDFTLMEELISDIKKKRNIESNLESLTRLINRVFNKVHIKFTIANNTTGKFFGMSIYPDISLMDMLVDTLFSKEAKSVSIEELWRENQIWKADIDSLLLYDEKLFANPSEIVAILLHEIGHIIYSNEVPRRIHKVFKMKMFETQYKLYKLCGDSKFRKLFSIPILDACNNKSFNSRSELKKETIADKFVNRYGYGPDLVNFINKLLKVSGNELIDKSEDDLEKDISISVTWTLKNIDELRFRADKLRMMLDAEKRKQNSPYLLATLQNLYHSIFGARKDPIKESTLTFRGRSFNYYEDMGNDAIVKYANKVYEGAILDFFDKFGKVKRIYQSDIDIIRVEADRIETHDDKIYVLDRVYDSIVIIDRAIDLLREGRKNKVRQTLSELEDQRKQLQDIRRYIMTLKIVDKAYGVFIKYPKGYEG